MMLMATCTNGNGILANFWYILKAVSNCALQWVGEIEYLYFIVIIWSV